jgi:hypothetical protein
LSELRRQIFEPLAKSVAEHLSASV